MKSGPWMVVLLVLVAAAVVRIRLLETPLERDEGEYAYAGQLMLEGIPPYQLAYNMKLPGTYAAYAVLMAALGETVAGIHAGLLLVNAAAIVLVAVLGTRLFGAASGLAACAAYALMSLGSEVMGTQAHATHFVVLAALGGAVLQLKYFDSRRLAVLGASGLLFGLAFVMKQHGIFFGAFGALSLAVTEWRNRRPLMPAALGVFCGALAAPFAVTCLLLWRAGVFAKFWFWTFTYARIYASEVSLSRAAAHFADAFPPIFEQNAALWILAVAGLVRIWWKKADRPAAAFASGLIVFSFLAVCPGWYFRGHYFILLLPAVALLAGAAIRERRSYGVLAAALLLSVFTQRDFLFRMGPFEASREIYGRNPFPEAIPVARFIRDHSEKNSRIAVLGSEPEIAFYAHRHSVSPYIYMYPLMESQPYALAMQEDMIREVTAAAPEFVVEAGGHTSWLRSPASPGRIFDWWSGYRAQHYRLVGIADIASDGPAEYRWDADAEACPPQSDDYLAVYRRNDAPASASRMVSPAAK
jgi:hypothetical protein